MRVLAVFSFILISMQAIGSNIGNLILNGSVEQESVKFTITNTSLTPTSISYIVIQDNILVRSEGNRVLQSGEVFEIEFSKASGTHNYTLTVTENSGSSGIMTLTI